MSKFEVLVLNRDWLINHANSHSRENISRLLNKAYAQARFKFNYIASPRVKNGDNLLKALEIERAKEFVLYVLLGPADKFTEWKVNGFQRTFKPSNNLQEAYDSNIPEEYLQYLQFHEENIQFIAATSEFHFDDEILNRSLVTCGFKSKGSIKSNKELTLTAFTSFIKDGGSNFLEVLIKNCLMDYKLYNKFWQEDLSEINKIIIQADVVKEHKLVEYYVNKCSFKKSLKEDIYVSTQESPFQDDNKLDTIQPFHISFIYREIELK